MPCIHIHTNKKLHVSNIIISLQVENVPWVNWTGKLNAYGVESNQYSNVIYMLLFIFYWRIMFYSAQTRQLQTWCQ